MLRFGTVAVVILLTVACSPLQTAAPAPTPTPLAVLATRYTQMVAPSNASLDAVFTALGAQGANVTTTHAAFQSHLDALTTLNAQLSRFQADLPASARTDVQQLRHEVAVELTDVEAILSATAQADWLAAVLRWEADLRGFSAAQLVRADLGLPPAGTTPSPKA